MKQIKAEWNFWKCSNCGCALYELMPEPPFVVFQFCPNCGARMTGEYYPSED